MVENIEKSFYELCQKYNNPDNNDYKGSLLYKAFESEKYGEELLASYITSKQKFDCLYAFLITKSRIIEINSYSTMFIVSSKKFKYIKKVVVEQDFDDKQVEEMLSNNIYPERVQIKAYFVDYSNEVEELSWENIESKENIAHAVEFGRRLFQLQADN